MTITTLQFINSALKRARIIQGDAGELVTSTVTSTATGLIATGAFTDSARQGEIDIMIQIMNEALMEVGGMKMVAPYTSTATISLVTAQREYTMPSDFERMAGNTKETIGFRGATRQWTINEYPGGYSQMLFDQAGLASQYQGEPRYFAIVPGTIQTVRFDAEPTSAENGWTYKALYHQRITRSSTMATTAMPFADSVIDALVPVVAEGWKAEWKKEFNEGVFRASLTRAIERATQNTRRSVWGPQR